MNTLFFVFLFFFFLILQTCILPCSSCLFFCFALELVPVLLVSILYNHYAACICLALTGMLMDSLSGCPFFTHMFSYIWIYFMIQFFKRVVFLKNFLFVLVIALLSIFIELVITVIPALITKGGISYAEFGLYWEQGLLSMLTVPPMLWVVDSLRIKWLAFVEKSQSHKKSNY